MLIFLLFLLIPCFLITELDPLIKKRLTSKERLNKIKSLLSSDSIQSESEKWDLVRQELGFLNYQIKTNKKFSLKKYLKKNNFMNYLLNLQIQVDKDIKNLLD